MPRAGSDHHQVILPAAGVTVAAAAPGRPRVRATRPAAGGRSKRRLRGGRGSAGGGGQ
jgi:hypothetical protein